MAMETTLRKMRTNDYLCVLDDASKTILLPAIKDPVIISLKRRNRYMFAPIGFDQCWAWFTSEILLKVMMQSRYSCIRIRVTGTSNTLLEHYEIVCIANSTTLIRHSVTATNSIDFLNFLNVAASAGISKHIFSDRTVCTKGRYGSKIHIESNRIVHNWTFVRVIHIKQLLACVFI